MEPVLLQEIIDPGLLADMIAGRFIKVVTDPETGLVLYNYTAHAQYDAEWNPATLACRGLITTVDGQVVARPFAKFFNYTPGLVEGLGGPVEVTDKLDGSLGVLYPCGDTWKIATRGSFISAQALHATGILHTRHQGFAPREGWTYLFEIIYPANRIVVDYRERDELILLGAVEIASGRSVPVTQARTGWDGPVVDVMTHATLQDALTAEPRSNAEGMVVHFVDHDVRVKLKQDDYVRLHRLVTDVSERRVWEVLAAGGDLGEWLEAVPDELYRFVATCRDSLTSAWAALRVELQAEHDAILAALPDGWTRRDLGLAVTGSDHPLAKGVFALVDGKSVDGLLWAQLRPAEHVPYLDIAD